MRKHSNTLDVKRFEKDFSSLIRLRDDKDTVIKDVIARVNAAKADIDTFLKSVDEMEDEKVQKSCRRAAIAQMYHVRTEEEGGYPYIARQAYGDVFLIVIKHNIDGWPVYSTAVVSRYGDIIIDEGKISVKSSTNYGWGAGWIFKRVGGDKYGLISDYGDVLIPCVFDSCYTNVGIAYCFYKGVAFELTVYGKQNELENKWIKQIIGVAEKPDCLICRSVSGVLFTLRADEYVHNPSDGEADYDCEVDSSTYHEAVKEVKAFMSPFIISQEELKKFVGKQSCGYEICEDRCIIYDITEIKDECFMGYGFSEVELPETLERIGKRAFYECRNLKSIRIPKSVTSIGECAFGFCRNLESIEVEEGNPNYRSERNCLLACDGKTLFCGCRSSKIPNSVEHIDDNAFYACGLTAIEIPSGVATIGKNAFFGCAITSIKIPPSVTTIGENAFAACRDLKSIEIPDSIKDYSALQECKGYLRDIYLPSGGPMNYRGFEWQTLRAPWFRGVDRMVKQNITLHVPAGTEEEYRKDSFFGTFGAIVTIA